ncbi:hypothetical protein LTR85_005148 [Meristemomyces frigidus]|nr:hypothetical protein LTR85_005148 [Meristemomyces frigidus]
MEKYGQYRDKGTYNSTDPQERRTTTQLTGIPAGSGVAPFFPVSPPASSPLLLPWYLFLCFVRIPLLAFAWLVWLTLIQWLPAGTGLRKANQWCLLGVPGVWWIDLQVDGVRRGSLGQTPSGKLPYPGSIIASSWTSPLDVLYLAAIWDPIFTQSLRGNRLVREISQESALAACFNLTNPLAIVAEKPLVSLETLVNQNPSRVIVVFPEGTTSNGRGILKFTPSLTSAGSSTKVYPVSLRYTPADVVTPIPGWLEALRFIWRLNSAGTHCIRVRIGAATTMAPAPTNGGAALDSPSPATTSARTSTSDRSTKRNSFESNFFDTLQASPAPKVTGDGSEDSEGDDATMTAQERRRLDAVAEDLARLGRVKRVNLGVAEKARFVEAWAKRAKSRK